jgi:vitamin B12 transporter
MILLRTSAPLRELFCWSRRNAKTRGNWYAAFAAVSVLPISAQAQSDIIVTGTALPPAKGDAAYDVTIIDRERLNATASNRVEDALRDVAGLQQFRRTDARSANATSQGATLRGLGGNASSRALLVLDGVPQSDPFGGWVTWPAYSPERLQRIFITRGGGSGVYGSGALSGTIEMESIGTGKGVFGNIAYGSRESVDANAMLSGALGQGFGFVTASYTRGTGFIPIIESQRGAADIAAPYEQFTAAARGVVPLSSHTELQASFLAFTDQRTRGTILSGNGGDGADVSLRLVHRGHWQLQALGYLQLRKFQSRFVSIDATRTTVVQTVDQYNVPSTGTGARFEVRPPLAKDLELRLGGDWRRTVGETNELFGFVAGRPTRAREAGGKSDVLGAFAELTARLGHLTLTGGGRIDRWSIRNGRLLERTIATGVSLRADRPADRNGWEPTGRVGIAYEAGSVTLRSAAYLGWRLPTLNELYRPFRVGADATAANPTLKPERMRGTEIGVLWRHEGSSEARGDVLHAPARAEISATVFANRLTEAIANVTLGNGPGVFPGVGFVAAGGAYRQRLNVDAVRSHGIELNAKATTGDFSLAASYTYADAKVRSSSKALSLNGLRPAQVPKHLASATLGWRWLSATVRHVSTQFEDDANSRELGAATTFDAVTRIPLGKGLKLNLRGENLANTRVEAAISAAGVIERASPRTLWIGLSYGD